MNNITTRRFPPHAPGFSLVEVALAVAIAALGIITCLGLLPEGLEMSRRTVQLAINSNILEQIIRDAENASWPVLKPAHGLPSSYPMQTDGGGAGGQALRMLYDSQGSKIEADSGQVSFVAEVGFSGTCVLPGNPASANEPFLARLVIRVANSQDPEFKFPTESQAASSSGVTSTASYLTFYHLVAKNR